MRKRREEAEAANQLRLADPGFVAAALSNIADNVAEQIVGGLTKFYGVAQPPAASRGITASGTYSMIFNGGGHGYPAVLISVTLEARGPEFLDINKMHYALSGYVRVKQAAGAAFEIPRDLLIDKNYDGNGHPGVSAENVCKQIESAFR